MQPFIRHLLNPNAKPFIPKSTPLAAPTEEDQKLEKPIYKPKDIVENTTEIVFRMGAEEDRPDSELGRDVADTEEVCQSHSILLIWNTFTKTVKYMRITTA